MYALNDRCYRLLPPLLRAFNSLPPSSSAPLASPLAEVIHSLITIPFSPALRPVWLRGGSTTPDGTSSSGDSKPGSPTSSGSQAPGAIKSKPTPMDRALICPYSGPPIPLRVRTTKSHHNAEADMMRIRSQIGGGLRVKLTVRVT